ncbi:hypothetical protein BKA70DRAFT_1078542, partial [Coprinopsis sp. MPI-PUGE-AT-0042]
MASTARDYHEALQKEGKCFEASSEAREAAIQEALGALETRVTEKDSDDLAKKLEEEEVREAIRATQVGKASGVDGIPIEMYKELQVLHGTGGKAGETPQWVDITRFMLMVFNDIEENGVDPKCGFAE